VYLTCYSRVSDRAIRAVKTLNQHKKIDKTDSKAANNESKSGETRDFGLKTETGSLKTASTATLRLRLAQGDRPPYPYGPGCHKKNAANGDSAVTAPRQGCLK
jgi:hypothetical protein